MNEYWVIRFENQAGDRWYLTDVRDQSLTECHWWAVPFTSKAAANRELLKCPSYLGLDAGKVVKRCRRGSAVAGHAMADDRRIHQGRTEDNR